MLNSVVRIMGATMAALGVVCTILLIGMLWRQATVEKNNFYVATLTIAFLDLLFNVLCFFHSVWYRLYKITGSSSLVSFIT